MGAEVCREHGGLGGGSGGQGLPSRSRTASCEGPGPLEARAARLCAWVFMCRLCLSLLSIYI